MNDLDHDSGLERRLEDYYDHTPQPLAVDGIWAHIASHLDPQQGYDDANVTPETEQHTVDDIHAVIHGQPTLHGRHAHRSPVWAATGAFTATLLLVALAGVLFADLGRQRVGQPSLTGTPQVSAAPTIRADIPAGAWLEAMTMTAADTGWAVGYVNNAGLILQYSQRHWRTAASGFTGYKLDSIVMASPDEGWAEGRPVGGGSGQILLHYAKGQWQQMALPVELPARTAQGQLAMHRGSGWVVAYVETDSLKNYIYTLYHYADGAWSQVATPAGQTIFGSAITPSLDGAVISFGADDAWVIASKYSNGVDNFPAHYHAGQWTSWSLPIGWSIGALAMTSPTDGWAEGKIQGPSNTPADVAPLLLHFDGHTWTRVTTPQDTSLKYVVLTGSADGWAFAMTSRPGTSVEHPSGIWSTSGAYHFHQGAWQQAAWPYTGSNSLGVLSLTQVSDNEYWGIAYRESPANGQTGSLLLHYVSGTWMAYGSS